ncbi:MAG: DJ-1/PfpI family protein [Desulfosarcinaceae bacterium]
MNRLSRVFLINLFMIAFLIFSALPGATGEKATKEECISMVNKAFDMIEKDGLDEVIPKINDKKGPFVRKGTYVFLMDTKEAKVLAHPYFPQNRHGMSLIATRDVFGKEYFREFMNVANSKGKGWVDYVFMDTNNRAREKITYVRKSEKADVTVLAGIFTDKKVASPQYNFPDMALPDIHGKKVALIIANKGFADNEFRVPKNMIEKAGGKTEVFALSKGTACGMYGLEADVRYSLDDIRVPEFDAIVFVGGTGSNVYHENPKAHKIAQEVGGQSRVFLAADLVDVEAASHAQLDLDLAAVVRQSLARNTSNHNRQRTGSLGFLCQGDYRVFAFIIYCRGPAKKRRTPKFGQYVKL